MIAVTLLFAVIAGMFAPRLGMMSARDLQNEAESLSSEIELGRQRAVVTGTPHRVVLDLEQGSYRLEWLTTEAEAYDEAPVEEAPALDLRGRTPIPMAPPTEAELDYFPVPGTSGNTVWLDDDLIFDGFESDEGWFDRGEAYIVFHPDGTATGARIHLGENDEDGHGLVLEILPLADSVRIFDAEES
jgi:hypothetical protein